ncbi:MAG: GxxExxY protein [Ignavibacteriae bacterium]|nr:GxxExxY protein [Ignavibacteriota bacterium]
MADEFLYGDLTYAIIGAAMEVHKTLGHGFSEYVYEEALCYEMGKREIPVERQKDVNIRYKDYLIPRKYRLDVLVDGKVIVDNKATSGLTENDEAQLLNYLKATGLRVGLLLNFGRASLEYKRMIL